MHKILCSTGALLGRANFRNYKLLESFLPRLNCDGIEFMLYGVWYDQTDEITRFLRSLKTNIPVMHCEKLVGDRISRNAEDDYETAIRLFEVNCGVAEKIGAETMVLHLWGGEYSDKEIERNYDAYNRLRKIADRHSVTLAVENVVCAVKDPMTHLRALSERYPDISFTFDTKMAAFHQQLDALYTPENRWLAQHIRHMHINDYAGGYKDWPNLRTLHVGTGKINFGRVFQYVRDTGYQGDFTVEATSVNEDGSVDFNALNRTFERIREYLNAGA